MKKSELIERIIDTLTGMGSEDPTDTASCHYITLKEAKNYLEDRRAMEKADFTPDEWLPEEVTPELYMEAFNCYIRKCKHDITLEHLVEYFTDGELIDTFHEFEGEYHNDKDKTVYPTDFLNEDIEFPFTQYDLTMLDLINIGRHSYDFNSDEDFCWYDEDSNELHSTDTPFKDGLIDAKAFCEWVLEDNDRIDRVQSYMVNTQIDYVFRYWGERNG